MMQTEQGVHHGREVQLSRRTSKVKQNIAADTTVVIDHAGAITTAVMCHDAAAVWLSAPSA
jgi:hypothetical protein